MKLAIVTPDGLSTVLYARSFAAVLARDPVHRLVTVSSTDGYESDIGRLNSEHYGVPMARFVDQIGRAHV